MQKSNSIDPRPQDGKNHHWQGPKSQTLALGKRQGAAIPWKETCYVFTNTNNQIKLALIFFGKIKQEDITYRPR